MLNCYCPSCGAKVAYEAIKPTKCPKCDKSFASAFKVVAVAPLPISQTAATFEDDTAAPSLLTASILKARNAKVKRSPRPIVLEEEDETVSHIMNAPPGLVVEDDTEDFGDEVEDVGRGAVRRRARELVATINPDAIKINSNWGGEGAENFKTYWDAGADARAKGGEAKKPAKRKARR